MKHNHYFPRAVAEQRAWLVNFKKQIAILGPGLGLSTAQVAQDQADCQAMIDDIDNADELLNAGKAGVQKRNLSIRENMIAIRNNVGAMKHNSAYTADQGATLQITGDEMVINFHDVKPIVKLLTAPQGVDIKFDLLHAEGANVYCQRGDEVNFTYLKHVTHPHTIDTRANLNNTASEKRQYRVTLVVNDEEVGNSTDIVTINN